MGTAYSSLPWHHLQHTIGGPAHPFPLSSGDSAGNDRGSPPLTQQEEDQLKMPLREAAVLSPRSKSPRWSTKNLILQDG
ncbi:unnamed protein product [Spirodela intermedia]|uniref:Uncharacterized protein n=1 Tax=Spirodela intermedia TaxID=51605 RepID=A0A7I8JR11_SPIIN|nr:unnamed protein product [Spirodela intermedia]CAA6672598.1 unnamed protein product [Spirodela intermedia]